MVDEFPDAVNRFNETFKDLKDVWKLDESVVNPVKRSPRAVKSWHSNQAGYLEQSEVNSDD
jgi:hypothetical protein